MQDSTTREKVLKKIRNALISKTANPYPNLDFDSSVFRMNDEVPELIFAQAFKEAGGQFVFCNNMLDFAEGLLNLAQSKKWTELLCVENALYKFLNECEFPLNNDPSTITTTQASVTLCECLVARTGSIMVSSAQTSGRGIPVFTPVHVVVAFPDQLVDDIKDAFNFLKSKYKDAAPSSTTFITGPGKTADIGNEVVIGAQGPVELYLFLVDKSEW